MQIHPPSAILNRATSPSLPFYGAGLISTEQAWFLWSTLRFYGAALISTEQASFLRNAALLYLLQRYQQTRKHTFWQCEWVSLVGHRSLPQTHVSKKKSPLIYCSTALHSTVCIIRVWTQEWSKKMPWLQKQCKVNKTTKHIIQN